MNQEKLQIVLSRMEKQIHLQSFVGNESALQFRAGLLFALTMIRTLEDSEHVRDSKKI